MPALPVLMTAPLKTRILSAAIPLAVLTIYLALPTRNYYWDGIGFAQNIEDSPHLSSSLLHPSHLMYTVSGWIAYRLVQDLGLHPRALTVLRVANSVFSAACVYLIFEIIMGCFGSTYMAAVLTAVFAFSATWWKFSTDANAYIPAVLFLLITFRIVLPQRPMRPAVTAIAHSGAMLFHELSILFYPVAVAGLWQQTAGLTLRRRVAVVIEYTAITFLITAGAYFVGYSWLERAGAYGGSSNAGFLRWITSHAPDSSFSWNIAKNVLLSLRGHLRLFLGGRVNWSVRQWPYFSSIMILILLGLLTVFIHRLVKLRRTTKQPNDPPAAMKFGGIPILITTWITCYAVFLFFWLPGNTFYRLFYLPPLVLLCGFWWKRQRSATQQPVYAAALLAGMIMVANFAFDIFPNSRVESNPPLEFAMGLDRFWRAGTLVYYGSFNTDNWTIRYFHPETSWRKFETPGVASPNGGRLDAAGDAWLDTTALDMLFSTAGGFEWLSQHTPEKVRVELVSDRHRIVFQKVALGN